MTTRNRRRSKNTFLYRRDCITREDLEVFGFTAKCPGCMSLLKGTARQAHTENCRMRIEELLRAAHRRVNEYQDTAAERGTIRAKSTLEEGQTDPPTSTTSSSSSNAALASQVPPAVATQ